jgi:hypothetical protein
MAANFDNFMNHKREFEYIVNVATIQLGSGYSYTSKPISPQLKKFTLHFSGFRYYFNADGTIDYETNKTLNNLGALCQFYEEMNMYTTFLYNDQQFGEIPVRFAEAMKIPKGVGDRGVVEDFRIVLQETPN